MEESKIETLKEEALNLIEKIQLFDQEIRDNSLENEQWFLDFQDDMNALSVK